MEMTSRIITADDAAPLFRAAMERIAGSELLGVRLLDHLVLGDEAAEDGRGFVSIFERMES